MKFLQNFVLIVLLGFSSCHGPKQPIVLQTPPNAEIISEFLPHVTPGSEDWQKEAFIAAQFAKEMDFYRALSGFKRARFLAKEKHTQMDLTYQILLCYFLANKYDKVIQEFENSPLKNADSEFEYFDSLLIILEHSYTKLGLEKKSQKIFKILEQSSQEKAALYKTSKAIMQAELINSDQERLKGLSPSIKESLKEMLDNYENQRVSVEKAGLYNALLPGAGYLYLGQNKSAFTAFCLNSLFILAAQHFFEKGQIAAGIITTGFELGWYLGGIQGAMLSANRYNANLYQKKAHFILERERLYPVFFLERQF